MAGRMIEAETWEDDFFTSLHLFGRVVWLGLITSCADDQGRMQDSAALVRSKIFPVDDIAIKEIEASLEEFYKVGKIARYTANGKKLIQIVNWWKHQKPRWAGRSLYPAPPGWIDRERFHAAGNEIIETNWKLQGGYIANYSGDYTDPNTTNEGDVKGDVKGEGDNTPPPPNIFDLYHNNVGEITKMISDALVADEKEYSAEWVSMAIKEAVDHGVRNLKYIEAILKSWKLKGLPGGNNSKANGHKKERDRIKNPSTHKILIRYVDGTDLEIDDPEPDNE